MNETTNVFNVFAGTIQQVLIADLFILGPGYLPVTKLPKNSCNKCYGRKFVGRDHQNFTHIPCSCVQKVLNFDILKKLEDKYTKRN